MDPPDAVPTPMPLVEVIAAGIAHEVRNPLNAVQINVQILEQELAELVPDRGAHVYAVLGKIARELQSLDAFVTAFLRYARPPALAPETLHVRTFLCDLASLVRPECARDGVELVIALDRAPVTVVADGFHLKHAVLNLVRNAREATAPGGRVIVEALVDGPSLVIAVRDSGTGMTEDVCRRAFDVFFSTKEGGSGLGLPIARRIVEEHGGTLNVASALGDGTCATIRVPLRAGA